MVKYNFSYLFLISGKTKIKRNAIARIYSLSENTNLFDKIVVERNLIYPSNTGNKWREIGSRQEFIEMALVCITQRGLENGWKNNGWRIDDKSFVNLRNDWIVVMCYAVM